MSHALTLLGGILIGAGLTLLLVDLLREDE